MSLIERIEQAEGPSRELDAEIHASLALEGHRMHPYLVGTFINDGRSGAVYSCPAYTSSIDAALMLVPEGWRLGNLSEHNPGDGKSTAHLVRKVSGWGGNPDDRKDAVHGYAATPALALAAAALKAKEANDGK